MDHKHCLELLECWYILLYIFCADITWFFFLYLKVARSYAYWQQPETYCCMAVLSLLQCCSYLLGCFRIANAKQSWLSFRWPVRSSKVCWNAKWRRYSVTFWILGCSLVVFIRLWTVSLTFISFGWVLWLQNDKGLVLWTQGCQRCPLKPGVGQNIYYTALRDPPAVRNSALSTVCLSSSFTFIFVQSNKLTCTDNNEPDM